MVKKCYEKFYIKQDEICEALKIDKTKNDCEILFDYCALAYSRFIVNMHTMCLEVKCENILGFFTSVVFNKLNIIHPNLN